MEFDSCAYRHITTIVSDILCLKQNIQVKVFVIFAYGRNILRLNFDQIGKSFSPFKPKIFTMAFRKLINIVTHFGSAKKWSENSFASIGCEE